MEEYSVRTERMAVGYDGVPLIEEIEIKLHRGEILTLIGPNGVGKSTVLKSFTRQLATVDGVIYLDGQDMKNISRREFAKKLSMVMTERIHPELFTCGDVVATGRYPYTGNMGILTSADWESVYQAMELVDVMELRACDFMEISDGQRQRIMLARAICQEPGIMILDEPTSYLDIKYKLELLSILKKLARQRNVTVIMSLHEIDLAQKISDRILCMREHHVDSCGTPEEIFSDDYIGRLYDVSSGSYNALSGGLELAAVQGSPMVFVVGGGGKGIPLYRMLQKKELPFAAGVLHGNDVEYQIAKRLAVHVIEEKAFCPIGEESLQAARRMIDSCEYVVDGVQSFGIMNAGNKTLLDYADKSGKLCKIEEIVTG